MKDYITTSSNIEKKIDTLLTQVTCEDTISQETEDVEQIKALKEAYGLQSAKRIPKEIHQQNDWTEKQKTMKIF